MGGCKILRDRFLHEHDPVFLALLLSPFSRLFRDLFLIFVLLFVLLVYVFQEEPCVGGSQGALCVLYVHSL